jgi:BASS family bile acid:Na+ symporter
MSIKLLIRSVLESTEFILLVAIVIPLLFVVNMTSIRFYTEIIFGIVMFLSIRPFFKQKSNFTLTKNIKGVFISLLINYVLLSGIYLLFGLIFFSASSEYFIGYILLAIVPPAIAIVPLCYLTKCDINVADKSLVLGYFLALIIIPASLYLIFGNDLNFILLARSLILLILLPIFLAYITKNVNSAIFNYTKIINNILLGLVVFTIISINRSTLLNMHDINIIYVFIMNLLIIFALGLIVYFVSKKFVSRKDAIDYSLYATQKNEATGLAIVLLMFNNYVAIPLIIALVVQFLYFIFFERFVLSNSVFSKNIKDDAK